MDAVELKRKTKMLYQAQLMQYEDDFDDQDFYTNRNKKKQEESSDDEDNAKTNKTPDKKVII